MSVSSACARIVWFRAGDTGRDPANVKIVPLGSEIVIGRDPGSGICLHDPKVSRKHTRVVVAPGGARATDLNSGNGTWIGGERVRSAMWYAGQPMKIGIFTLTYDFVDGATARPPVSGAASRSPYDETRPIMLWAFVAAFVAFSTAASVLIWQMTPSGPPAVSTVAAAAPKPLPFAEALPKAVEAVLTFSHASQRPVVMIDPLIDGGSGGQTIATQAMGRQVIDHIKEKHPELDVIPIKASAIATLPFIFIGTLTPVNSDGQAKGPKDVVRVCLALLDLKTGLVTGKARQFALPQSIDTMPSAFFRDSPVYARDDMTEAYLNGCHKTTLNGPIPVNFREGLAAEELIQQAIEAYNAGRYADAHRLFDDASAANGGAPQLRVLNGRLLTQLKLGRSQEAAATFESLVDYGLRQGEFSLVGVTMPTADGSIAASDRLPPNWLTQIADRIKASPSTCVEVVENSNRTGDDEQATLGRAQKIVARMVQRVPALRNRLRARGAGASEPLIGTGRNDDSDALDRRTYFKMVGC